MTLIKQLLIALLHSVIHYPNLNWMKSKVKQLMCGRKLKSFSNRWEQMWNGIMLMWSSASSPSPAGSVNISVFINNQKKVFTSQHTSFDTISTSTSESFGSAWKVHSLPSGQRSNLSNDKSSSGYETSGYEASGERLRDAIKNCDMSMVKELLMSCVDANYYDKQVMPLMHLAMLFYPIEIDSTRTFSLLYSLM